MATWRIPQDFSTPEAALAAPSVRAFDTLLIAGGPYTLPAAGLTLDRPVHLKADTEDPVAAPVILQKSYAFESAGNGYAVLNYRLAEPAGGDLFVEGLTLRHADGSGFPAIRCDAAGTWHPSLRLIVNRCDSTGGASQCEFLAYGCTYAPQIEFRRCRWGAASTSNGHIRHVDNPAARILLSRGHLSAALSTPGIAAGIVPSPDYVAANTPDYGPAYPPMLYPWGEAQSIRIAAGSDYAGATALLFYAAEAGGMEPDALRTATADAAGAALFEGLSDRWLYYSVFAPAAGPALIFGPLAAPSDVAYTPPAPCPGPVAPEPAPPTPPLPDRLPFASLLPPNAAALERALEAPPGARLAAMPVPLRWLWQPAAIPAPLLPWLAWALSVDEWGDAWPEAKQRAVVARSIELHRIKGTPAAVRMALEDLGYIGVKVVDGSFRTHDGTYRHDGSILHNNGLGPYRFGIELSRADGADLTSADIAAITAAVEKYKNARSHLREVRTHQLIHNGAAIHDGSETHNGGVQWAS